MKIYIIDLSKIDINHEKLKKYSHMHDMRKIGSWIAKDLVLDIYQRKSYEMITNQFGKPYFYNKKNQYFNISHSKNIVVVAIDYKEIGVDVEMIRVYEFGTILDFLGESAVHFANNRKEEDCFLKCWVMKEAISKKFGLSLLKHGQDICLLEKNNEWRGRFKSYEVACGYIEEQGIIIGWAKEERTLPIVEHLNPNFILNKPK